MAWIRQIRPYRLAISVGALLLAGGCADTSQRATDLGVDASLPVDGSLDRSPADLPRSDRPLDTVTDAVDLGHDTLLGPDAADAQPDTGGLADLGVCGAVPQGPFEATLSVPGWADRSYTLYVPASYKCTVPAPVVLALHGGGRNREDMALVTCPGTVPLTPPGQPTAAGCLVAAASQRGFVTVFPDGNKNPWFPNQDKRTFNAGGGSGAYTCVSAYACSQGKDDVAYFKGLVAELGTVIHVDPKRIFATGVSNGAAMSHRLACEMSTTIAAIAPVAGGNQLAAVSTCGAQRPVPVLSIHGDADPYWPFWGGPAGGGATGNMVAIPEGPGVVVGPSTLAGWRVHNGCDPTPTTKTLPDVDPTDGSTVEVLTYTGCNSGADVVLYRVAGGGHTWPGGWQYYPVTQVGPTNRDINASEVMLDFFESHPMP